MKLLMHDKQYMQKIELEETVSSLRSNIDNVLIYEYNQERIITVISNTIGEVIRKIIESIVLIIVLQ